MKNILFFVSIILLPFGAVAQCTPAYYGTGIAAGSMGQFALSGYSGGAISDVLPSSALSSGYSNRSSAVGTLSLQQGRSYSGSVTFSAPQGYTGNQVWIDFNNDDVFSDSEMVSAVFPGPASLATTVSGVSFIINIPVNAATGNHLLRIRNIAYDLSYTPGYSFSRLDPCNHSDSANRYHNGVTADYSVHIVALPSCSGTPTAGVATGPAGVCAGSAFSVTVNGDSVAGGLHYQWFAGVTGSGFLSPVSGATNITYNSSGTSVSTDYQLVTTCSSSGSHDSSTVITIPINPFYECYCNADLGGNSYDATIDSVSVMGTLLSASFLHHAIPYTAFPDTGTSTTMLMVGEYYSAFLKSGGNRPYAAHLWIDYNHNGVFDSTEHTLIDSAALAAGIAYKTFQIPVTADTGLTGMRIRTVTDSTSLSSSDACSFARTGQTEDYIVRLAPVLHCVATPYAGTAASSQSSVCAGVPFFVTSASYTSAIDVTFQWFSRATGSSSPFTAVSGATESLYTVGSQSVPTDYMLVVNCPVSGLYDTSNVVSVGENPFYLCYCSPSTGVVLNDFAFYAPIDSVSVAGTTLNSIASGTDLYASYYLYGASATATLAQGTHYTISVNSNGTGNYNAGVWIDYNHNGAFDAAEFISIASNQPAGVAASAIVYIPAIADTGLTGFRIRTSPAADVITGSDGCLEEYAGATSDYVINIGSGTPCSGSPVPGVSFATLSAACPGQSFTLNNLSAANTLGISYQWLSRTSGTGAYTNITGANSVSYVVSSISVATDYELVVSCSYSGVTDTSTVATVNVNPFYLCYCSPSTGTVLDDSATATPIDSFAISSTGLNNTTAGSTSIYTSYYPSTPGTTASLLQGSNYVMGINSDGTGNYDAVAWIDYNHSGTFESSEYIPISLTSSPGAAAFVSFVVPLGADTGKTGLRIRSVSNAYTMTSGDACGEFVDGATQDYVVKILPASPCTGTPTGGTAITYKSSVCASEPFEINATGYSNNYGITYQWIKAPAGTSSFTTISGATTPIFNIASQSAATDYRLVVTCSFSSHSDTSALVTVAMKPFYLCYCSPVIGDTLNIVSTTTPIDSVAEVGTTLNNYIPGNIALYQQFYPLTTSTTDSMRQGFSYTLAVNSQGTNNYNAGVWVDVDHNGTFDSSEYTAVGANILAGARGAVTVYIPFTADTGLTGLRVRTTQYPSTMGGNDGCTNLYYGATQDYVIRIAPGIPCSGTPSPGRAAASVSTICNGYGFTLADTGYSVGIGLSYQWYSRSAGTGTLTAISGATSSTLTISTQSVATDYVFHVACSSSGLGSYSDTVSVAETPYYSCYCGTPLGTSASLTEFNNVQIPLSALHVSGTYTGTYRLFGMTGDSTAALQQTLPYTIDLNVAGGSAFNAAMWIDYNHNGIFETTEYTLLDTNIASGTSTASSFTIPSGADTGITGVRIRATTAAYPLSATDACTDITNSQTYDFKVTIDTLYICAGVPSAGTISSSSPFACPAMTFNLTENSFTIGSGLTYQWVKRATGAISFSTIAGATTHNYTVSGQTSSTDYAIVAKCSFSGSYDTSNILTISENPFDSCYCSPPTGVPLVTSGGDTDIIITSMYGTTMDIPEHYPGATGYVSVPPTPSYNTASLTQGSAYPTTVYVNYTIHSISSAGVWIDYNHNSVFDSTEYTPLTQSSDHSNWAANVTIPYSATLGLTGMRIITAESGTLSASGSCSEIASGEVQDELVTITLAPCYSISSASVINVTDTTATAIWGRLGGARGYEYVIDSSSASPTGSGTRTIDTFVYSGCLVSGTNYYLHVRDSCGAGYFSSWFTVPFTTLPCRGSATITSSAITDHSVTITWDTVTGSGGYEYIVDTATGLPTGSGTYSTDTIEHLTGLLQGTTYYAHVRSLCPCGNVSPWNTISFTTICDTIAHLGTFGITDTSVNIKWDSILGFSNYAYVINTTPGAPSGGGTTTTDTTVYVHGLTPGTVYYAHVSHECSGSYSTWTTVTFSTPYCDTVTGLTVTSDDTGVVLHFTGVTGSLGYYYAVNIYSAAPAGTGLFTTQTTDTVTGLLSGTVYYVHVRTGCTLGYSSWETIPVTTPVCDTVRGLTVSSICDTSASVSWTAASGGTGYYYILNSSPTPTGSSLFTSLPYLSFNTLTPGTLYYFHVRHKCSAIDTSAWVTTSFTTTNCDTVAGLTVSAITATSAEIHWANSSCAAGYYCIINTSPATPTGTGTYVTVDSFPANALTVGTTYYAHIRVACGGGATSGWVTIAFTTVACQQPTSLTISAVMDNSATLTWPTVSTALWYEWTVDMSSAAPTSPGTTTTSTSVVDNSLTQHTVYYGHVRSACGVGIYSTWVTTGPFTTTSVGVQELYGAGFDIQAFPNPVTGLLTIRVTGKGENSWVTVTDITGNVLVKQQMLTDKTELDLSQLSAGMYLVRYTDDTHNQVLKMNKL